MSVSTSGVSGSKSSFDEDGKATRAFVPSTEMVVKTFALDFGFGIGFRADLGSSLSEVRGNQLHQGKARYTQHEDGIVSSRVTVHFDDHR